MPSTKAGTFSAQDVPNLQGYVAIVTGGNSGIGYETTFELAAHGARVYIAARSPERIAKAIKDMKASKPELQMDLRPLHMDLQDLKSVKDAADTFMTHETRLDLLINNAGIMAVPYALTTDGFEMHWQTNYLAPFFLVKSLLPVLEATATSRNSQTRVRVVNVSSDAAFATAPKNLDLAHPNLENVTGAMAAWRRYGHSKLASVLHARGLNSRLSQKGITAYALHPGIVSTNLQAADPTFVGSIIRHFVKWKIIPGIVTITDGARTTLFCALSPEAVEGAGGYFIKFGMLDKRGEGWRERSGEVDALWEGSERMVKEAGF